MFIFSYLNFREILIFFVNLVTYEIHFNMKQLTFLFGIVLSVFFAGKLSAQSSNTVPVVKPSDVPHGYTYDFDKAQRLILERLVQPSTANADVKPIVTSADFPKHTANTEVTKEYLEQLRIWMEKNPAIIIETLKPRKDIVQPY